MKGFHLALGAVLLAACSSTGAPVESAPPDLQYRLVLKDGHYTSTSHDSTWFSVILQSQVIPTTVPDTFPWSPVPNATLATNWSAASVSPSQLVTDGNGVASGVWFFGAPTEPGIEWSIVITWPAQPPGAQASITLYGWSGTTP